MTRRLSAAATARSPVTSAAPEPDANVAKRRANLHRIVRPIPPELLARATRDDEALNALRRQCVEPGKLERFVNAAAILLCVFIVSWFAAAFVSGAGQ